MSSQNIIKREYIPSVPERKASVVDGVVPLHLDEVVAAIDELGGGVLDAAFLELTVGHVAHGNGLRSWHDKVIANGKAAHVGQHIGIRRQGLVQRIVCTLFAGVPECGLAWGLALEVEAVEVCSGSCGGLKGDLMGKGLLQGRVNGEIEGDFHAAFQSSKRFSVFQEHKLYWNRTWNTRDVVCGDAEW